MLRVNIIKKKNSLTCPLGEMFANIHVQYYYTIISELLLNTKFLLYVQNNLQNLHHGRTTMGCR